MGAVSGTGGYLVGLGSDFRLDPACVGLEVPTTKVDAMRVMTGERGGGPVADPTWPSSMSMS